MVYLNQAATTWPKPQCVLDAHTAALYAVPAGQLRGGSGADSDPAEACRAALGRLLGIAATQRFVLTSGATDSANALVAGLPLAGGRVLVTQTEHNSVLRPLLNLEGRAGRVDVVPCDKGGFVSPDSVEAMLREDTAAVFVNHCSNVTGAIQDMPAIAEIAHRHGALIVADLAQSAGCVPVDADGWGIDALLFTGHKALFGPQGTGGHWVRPGIPFKPHRYGGTGRDSRRLTYEDGDYEFEPGTQNMPGIAALRAGVEYVLDRGVDAIMARERALTARLRDGLLSVPGVVVYGGERSNMGPAMSFNIRGLSPADAAYILFGGYDIAVRAGLQCAPLIHEAMGTAERGVVRASVSDMNTEDDVDRLIRAVCEIAAGVEAAT